MDKIEALEILLELPVDHLVALFEPRESGHIVAGDGSAVRRLNTAAIVEIDEDVVVADHVVQGGQHIPVGETVEGND